MKNFIYMLIGVMGFIMFIFTNARMNQYEKQNSDRGNSPHLFNQSLSDVDFEIGATYGVISACRIMKDGLPHTYGDMIIDAKNQYKTNIAKINSGL